LEKLNKRNVSVCAGGGAQLRQTHVLLSQSNNLHVIQTPDSEESFLIKVEGRPIGISCFVAVLALFSPVNVRCNSF